jgi:histidine decarboxylase
MTSQFEAPLTAGALRLDTGASPDIDVVLAGLLDWALERRPRQLGYPVATDVDFRPVQELFNVFLNNIGDPARPCAFNNSQQIERAVIDWFADLFELPATDRWGYVTTGGTESNLSGVHTGLRRFPAAVIYRSQAAHYSVAKIGEIVGREPLELVVEVDEAGEMNYLHLADLVARHRGRPAIVVATAGTTMTEARDDTTRINAILDRHAVPGRHVHVDAALSGIPLALDGTLRFTDTGGIDSITVSGHKWLGTPVPCGVMLMRDSVRFEGAHIAYTDTFDTTIAGSRSGQAAVLLWYAIAEIMKRPGGHHHRTVAARHVAAYACDRLNAVGWPAWRHDHAVTVVMRTPPPAMVTDRGWILATEGNWTHIICAPGVTLQTVDAFVADLAELIATPQPPRPLLPRQPNSEAATALPTQAA